MTDAQKNEIEKLRTIGWGYGRIAQQLGMSLNTVKSYCRRKRSIIEPSPPSVPAFSGEVTQCEHCGQAIHQISKQKKKRFCCDACRNKWWNNHQDLVSRKAVYTFLCPHCAKPFNTYGDSRGKYCSHACYIADRFGGGNHERG